MKSRSILERGNDIFILGVENIEKGGVENQGRTYIWRIECFIYVYFSIFRM